MTSFYVQRAEGGCGHKIGPKNYGCFLKYTTYSFETCLNWPNLSEAKKAMPNVGNNTVIELESWRERMRVRARRGAFAGFGLEDFHSYKFSPYLVPSSCLVMY